MNGLLDLGTSQPGKLLSAVDPNPHRIQRTGHPQPVDPGRDVQINLSGADVVVPQQLLDGTKIRSRLKQIGRKRVEQGRVD